MAPELLEPCETPPIGGLSVPRQFYQILRTPILLAGAMLPQKDFPWQKLHAFGFVSVVCLCSEYPMYTSNPMRLIYACELEDLACGSPPSDPQSEAKMVESAVDIALDEVKAGRGVLVHCAGGRGRTGTVIGGVLCRLGFGLQSTVAYLDRLHKKRGKSGWPEHLWQSDVLERFVQKRGDSSTGIRIDP